jgi:ligand-binding sensor domain-containing protein
VNRPKIRNRVLLLGVILAFTHCSKEETPVDKEVILPSNNITSIFIDKNDIKWFGTTAGLVCLSGEKWTTYTKADGIAGDSINSLSYQLAHNDSQIWVATNNGVSLHVYDVEGITASTIYRQDNSGLTVNIVFSVAVDVENTSWFGTKAGITVFSRQQWFDSTYLELWHEQVSCIGPTTDGWIYMGTSGSGVARYKFDDIDGITGASLMDSDWSRLPDDNVLSVFIDSANNQWFGTENGAAVHVGSYPREGWTVYTTSDGLISNVILSIFKDSKGVIWFGTPDGLSSKDGDKWQQYTVDNGLSGNNINAIAEDKEGHLWLATSNGISCFNGLNWTIYTK